MASILIDGRTLAHEQTSGVKRYVAEISRRLALACSSHEFEIARPPTSMKVVHHLWEHLYLPLRCLGNRFQLLFCPANIAPALKPGRAKLVLTIHGIAYRYFPESYSKSFSYYYSHLVPRSLKNADAIIAVSNAEKKSILAQFPWVAERKIHVVLSGIDQDVFNHGERFQAQQVLRHRYGIEGDFVLAVGSFKSVKNFAKLVEAYSSVADRLGAKLVLLCGTQSLPVRPHPDVSLIGYVGADMPSFYRAAKLLVCPSSYEGFGFPPLEAMACGCAVLASSAGALPEVCGDAAYYFNANDAPGMAAAIVHFMKEENLRRESIERGFRRVKEFTWERTVSETLKVFETLLVRTG